MVRFTLQIDTDEDQRGRTWLYTLVLIAVVLGELLLLVSLIAYMLLAWEAVEPEVPGISALAAGMILG